MLTVSTRSTVGIVLFLVSVVGGCCAAFVNLRMTELVNERLPKDQQIDLSKPGLRNIGRVARLYRELYPGGRLHRTKTLVTAASSILALIGFHLVGFF